MRTLQNTLFPFFLFLPILAAANITISTATDPTAAGNCDGTVTVEASGTAGPFEIAIMGGSNNFSDTASGVEGQHTFSGLCEGSYTLTVTNAFGCAVTLSQSLQVGEDNDDGDGGDGGQGDGSGNCDFQIEAVFQIDVADACQAGGGAVSLSTADDSALSDYTYAWADASGNPLGNTPNLSELEADNYTLTVTDADGCEDQQTIEVSLPEREYPYLRQVRVTAGGVLLYEAHWTETASACLEFHSSNIVLTAEDWAKLEGVNSLEIQAVFSEDMVHRPELNLPNSMDFQGMQINLSDASGWQFNVIPGIDIKDYLENNPRRLTFFGVDLNDGLGLLNLRDQSNDLSICAPIPELQPDCTWPGGVVAGSDDVHVIDLSCSSADFGISPTIVNKACPDQTNGSICVEVTGGDSPPYTFEWSTGATGPCLEGVAGGATYQLTVADACGKTEILAYFLENHPDIEIELVANQDACNNFANGRLKVSAGSGNGPYAYAWDNGANQAQADDIRAGEHCVTVTDAAGCIAEKCYSVGQQTLTVDLVDLHNSYSNQTHTGSIDIAVSGSPNGNFNYSWTGPDQFYAYTQDVEGLAPGSYQVRVSNGEVCSIVRTFRIQSCFDEGDSDLPTGPSIDSLRLEQIKPSIYQLGLIYIEIDPGDADQYTIQWTGPNGFSSDRTYLTDLSVPGDYCVTVNSGCQTDSRCFEIVNCATQPWKEQVRNQAVISGTCDGSSEGLNNLAFGTIELSTSTDDGPFSYMWDNGDTGPSIEMLAEGTYKVTVEDRFTCQHEETFNILADVPLEGPTREGECAFFWTCKGTEVKIETGTITVTPPSQDRRTGEIDECVARRTRDFRGVSYNLSPYQGDVEGNLIGVGIDQLTGIPISCKVETICRFDLSYEVVGGREYILNTSWYEVNKEKIDKIEWPLREPFIYYGQPWPCSSEVTPPCYFVVPFYYCEQSDDLLYVGSCLLDGCPIPRILGEDEIEGRQQIIRLGGKLVPPKKEIIRNSDDPILISNIFPNPFVSQLTLKIFSKSKKNISFRLVNALGQTVFGSKSQLSRGQQTVQLVPPALNT